MKIEKLPGKIVGLDLSLTSTGISSICPKVLSIVTRIEKTSSSMSYMGRYNKLIESIKSEIPSNGDIIFFIEGYSFGSFGKSSSASYLIELSGILKYDLWKAGISYKIVPPTLLKKFITGKGNAKKEDIKLHIYKRYGMEFAVSDSADAYGLMALGGAYYTGMAINNKELTAVEKECILKLKEMENDPKVD